MAHGFLPTVWPASGLVLRRGDVIQTAAGVLGAAGLTYRHPVEREEPSAVFGKKRGTVIADDEYGGRP